MRCVCKIQRPVFDVLIHPILVIQEEHKLDRCYTGGTQGRWGLDTSQFLDSSSSIQPTFQSPAACRICFPRMQRNVSTCSSSLRKYQTKALIRSHRETKGHGNLRRQREEKLLAGGQGEEESCSLGLVAMVRCEIAAKLDCTCYSGATANEDKNQERAAKDRPIRSDCLRFG